MTADAQVTTIFERGTDNLWTATSDAVPATLGGFIRWYGHDGTRSALTFIGYNGVEEHAQAADDTWSLALMYPLADWSCSNVYGATMTADGLRMLVSCYRTETFEDRHALSPSARRVTDEFGPLTASSEGAPQGVLMMTLTDDCSRVYFSALQSVFAAELETSAGDRTCSAPCGGAGASLP